MVFWVFEIFMRQSTMNNYILFNTIECEMMGEINIAF